MLSASLRLSKVVSLTGARPLRHRTAIGSYGGEGSHEPVGQVHLQGCLAYTKHPSLQDYHRTLGTRLL